jgi:hypothetical protein
MAALKHQAEASYLEQIIYALSMTASVRNGAEPSQPAHPPAPPPDYLCLVSQDIMADPVMLVDSGHTYEREAIEKWLSKHNTDPCTGEGHNAVAASASASAIKPSADPP